MSPTMFLGRVVLPGVGLLLAAVLSGKPCATDGRVELPSDPTRPAPTRRPRPVRREATGRITAEGRVVAYPGGEVTVGTEVLGTIINIPSREVGGPQGRPARRASRRTTRRPPSRGARPLIEAEAGLRSEQEPLRLRPSSRPSARTASADRHDYAAAASPAATPPRPTSSGSSRAGQVPHRRADRRRGRRAPRRPRRNGQPRRSAGDDRRPEPAPDRGRDR